MMARDGAFGDRRGRSGDFLEVATWYSLTVNANGAKASNRPRSTCRYPQGFRSSPEWVQLRLLYLGRLRSFLGWAILALSPILVSRRIPLCRLLPGPASWATCGLLLHSARVRGSTRRSRCWGCGDIHSGRCPVDGLGSNSLKAGL